MKIQNLHRDVWLMVLCCLIPVVLLGGALLLGVPVTLAVHQEAAYGAALLARDGTDLFPGATP